MSTWDARSAQGSHNSAEAEIPKTKEMKIYCPNTTKRYVQCVRYLESSIPAVARWLLT